MRKLLLLVAVLAVVVAASYSAPTGAVPVAEAHVLSCWHAQTVSGHPNAHCEGVVVGNHRHRVWLGFPWRSCWEYVDWTGWLFWHVNVGHCPGWH